MDEFRVDAVFEGMFLELLCDSARGDLLSEPVDEQETAFFSDPIQESVPEPDGQVDPPDPASFGVRCRCILPGHAVGGPNTATNDPQSGVYLTDEKGKRYPTPALAFNQPTLPVIIISSFNL